MILDTTSKTIEVILPGAITTNQLEITADWVDTANGSTFAPGGTSLLTNGGTAVTAVASPASSVQRQVKALTVYNADTVNQTVTVRMFDGTNRRRHIAVALAPGQSLVFTPEGGWQILTVSPGQIIGTATNDNAAAGCVGEYLSATLASGSAVALTSTVSANITSLTITPGDWDVTGKIDNTAPTTLQSFIGAINTTTATLPSRGDFSRYDDNPGGINDTQSVLVGPLRVSLASSTTYFLIVNSQFTGTSSAYGQLRARRVR